MSGRAIPIHTALKAFKPLWPYFVENRWAIVIGILSLLLVDFLQLLIPLVIREAVDLLTLQGREDLAGLLFRQGLIIVGLALVIAAFRYVWRHLLLGHSRRVEQRLRQRLYEHLQTQSLSFFHRMPTGDLMARAVNDINAVRMASGMGLVALVDGIVLGIAAIAFMVSIHGTLTLMALAPAPLVVFFSRILTRRMSREFETVQNAFSHLTEQVRESFAGIRVVKAFEREEWSRAKVEASGRTYLENNLTLARTLALFLPMMAVVTHAGLGIVILLGGRYTILGSITPGDLVAFITYLNLLTWPLMAMGWVTNMVQRGGASMRRINRILDEIPEIRDPDRPTPGTHPLYEKKAPDVSREGILIQGLSFRFPMQEEPALQDVHLRIAPGETVALVGRVGSGKTTLLRTLPRILEVSPKTVYVGGQDVRDIPLKALRSAIGFVSQDVFLFSTTIRNNVLFGRTGISARALEEALRIADIWEEIQDLEQGLDTPLGERGLTLSGGQRQRVTIARALVTPLPCLILDDALSMVDTSTEERILNRILDSRKEATCLIVSHRVSTIRRADRILVLEKGRLAEEGTHVQLIRSGGIYADLYQRQLLEDELTAAH